MPSFEGLSDDYVLRRRDHTRRELAETPAYLYQLYHSILAAELVELNAELSRRADAARLHADELELVGDDGSLNDALERLEQRRRESTTLEHPPE
jgi:hypothetical protein